MHSVRPLRSLLRLPWRASVSPLAVAAFLLTGAGLLAPGQANALGVGFSCITGNSATDCLIGEAQLSAEVIDLGGSQVLFELTNAGPLASSITDVYFDDGTLLGIAGLIDGDDAALGTLGDPNVDFSQNASPPNLPGGNTIGFQVTAGFLADSDPPTQPNGVNPNEMLGIVFDLTGGGTFADIVAELTDGRLRIGIHVQGFDGGGSESFVNVPVPEPSSALLIGIGLAALSRSRATPRRPR